MENTNFELLNRVKSRSSSLRNETLEKFNLSQEEFNSRSLEMNPFAEKVFNGVDVKSSFDELDASSKLIAVMTVCKHFANELDSAGPVESHYVPPSVDNFVAFLNNVPTDLALIGLRVEVCLERMITWNLDLLPQFSSLINNINQLKNNNK